MNPSKGEKPPFMINSRSHSWRWIGNQRYGTSAMGVRGTYLGEEDIFQASSFFDEGIVQVSVSDVEVLEDTAMGCVGHSDRVGLPCD